MVAASAARQYHRIRRNLWSIRFRQQVRRALDVAPLGPPPTGRLCVVLVAGAMVAGVCLGLAFAAKLPTAVGVAVALAAFVATVGVGAWVVLAGSDAILAVRQEAALRDLPEARADWLLYRKQVRVGREARRAEEAADREREEEAEDRAARSPATRPALTAGWLAGNGAFALEVVGESHYQRALEAVCGGRTADGQDRVMAAVLVLDDGNPYDPRAVRVTIGGRTVGFLARHKARTFRARIRREDLSGEAFECRAHVRGGWDRGGGDRGYFGIWLDVVLYGR